MKNLKHLATILVASFLLPLASQAQDYGIITNCMGVQAVKFNISGGVLESGIEGTVGSVIRYSNVNTDGVDKVDLLVEIVAYTDIVPQSPTCKNDTFYYDLHDKVQQNNPSDYDAVSCPSIWRNKTTVFGYTGNFQPAWGDKGTPNVPFNLAAPGVYELKSVTNKFTIVAAGTNTPVSLPIVVMVLDNDGTETYSGGVPIAPAIADHYSSKERVEFITPPTRTTLGVPTRQVAVATNTFEPLTNENQAGIGTGVDWMVYAYYANVSTFTIKTSNQFTLVDAFYPVGDVHGHTAGDPVPLNAFVRAHSIHIGCDFSTATTNLPVTLVDFKANKIDNKVRLNWEVASEINLDNYSIERSNDGRNFQTIGTVKAVNTSNYSFTDNVPNNGLNYYRLKNIDLDGKFAYSMIVRANIDIKNTYTILPNPVSDNATIRGLNIGDNVKVLSTIGRVLIEKIATQDIESIATNNLAKGMYIILITNNITGLKTSIKIVKD